MAGISTHLLPLQTPSATETSIHSALPWAGALCSQEDLELHPRAMHVWTLCGVLYNRKCEAPSVLLGWSL